MIEMRLIDADEVKEAVLSHHENEDGTGYPNGTRGDEQSEFTKILHVADVYDALISERVYKKPFSVDKAREIILDGSGTQFDPCLVPLFLECVRDS